jgi:tetratricopeptide (TPR) repeat protein
MKAEHRHELKTNELAEWIAHLPQWAKENVRIIIIVSAVVVLGAGSYFYYRYQKNVVSARRQLRLTELASQVSQGKRNILTTRATRGLDISFTLLQLADDLENFAQNAKNDQMAALALIKQAEALRAELHFRGITVSKQEITTQIRRAKESYNEALEKSFANPSLTAMARFGLGLCEEELGNFDRARQIYSDLLATTDLESTTAFVQAKQRVETMADYKQNVVFRPSPRPRPTPPPPITQPPPLTPLDINRADGNRTDDERADINRTGAPSPDRNLDDINVGEP